MKIYASRENLIQAVNIVQRAVSTKNPMPILSGIMLICEHNYLKCIGTDLDMGIECTVPVTIVEPGSVVISAKYFSEVVRRLPDMRIELEVNKNNNVTTIRYGSSEININGMSSEDFPILPKLDKHNSVLVNSNNLRNMIKQVSFATSNENNRPLFTGVLLEIIKDKLVMVATDTHRLAFRNGKVISSTEMKDISVIIPGKTINEISKIVGDDKQVEISFTENQVLFESESICLISRLINGQFPNYNLVFPQDYKSKIRVKTKDILEATERAALLSRDGTSIIKLTVDEQKMNITSNSPEVGHIYEEIPIFLEGEETSISFNSRYLLDVLKVVDADEIYLELCGSLSPGIIKPVDKENYLYLILPMRTF